MYTDIWKSVPFGVGEWFLRKSVKFVSMADKFGDISREITKISFNALAKRVSGKRVSTMFYAFNKLLKPEIEFMNWACTTWCVEKRWSFFRQKKRYKFNIFVSILPKCCICCINTTKVRLNQSFLGGAAIWIQIYRNIGSEEYRWESRLAWIWSWSNRRISSIKSNDKTVYKKHKTNSDQSILLFPHIQTFWRWKKCNPTNNFSTCTKIILIGSNTKYNPYYIALSLSPPPSLSRSLYNT